MKRETKLKQWKLPKWKKEFWKVFSQYIKKRDKGVCITCGRTGLTSYDYHAGHCIPAGACPIKLRYDERNMNGQCYDCNMNLEGMGAIYRGKVDEKYGKGTYKKLELLLGDTSLKYSREDYADLIDKYKEKYEDSQ